MATDGLAEAWRAGRALLEHPELEATRREALRLSQARFVPPPPVALAPELALAFWQDGALLPVTALESYGECPYKFFAGRMLRLSQRQEAMLNMQDLGTLRHGILDRLFRALRKDKTQGLDWGTVDPAEADEAIDRIVGELRLDKQWAARLEASALGGMTVEEVAGELKLFVRALGVVGKRCRFVQIRSEWIFGKNGEYTIQAGPRRFSIRGTIDRIDALPRTNGEPPTGVLVDYKSGRRSLSLARIMEGIDMQLLTYALAWRQACEDNGAKGARVGGFFYWPLAAPVREADAEDGAEGEAIDPGWFAKQKPSGLFAADLADWLDSEVGPESGSLAFSFRKTKTGSLHGAGQSHWPREDFEELLRYEEMILERWAGMIVQGRIAINPFLLGKTMACDMCDYGSLCRKADPVELAFRRIAGLRRDGAIERLRMAEDD
jgi:ATP-dependent helicase/nuclease subunit B